MSVKLKTESREQQSPEDRAGGNLPGREPEGLEDPPAYYWPQKQAGTLLCTTNKDVWSVRVSYDVLFPLSSFSCSYVILITCFIEYLISPFPLLLALPVPRGPPSCSFTLPTNFPAFVHIVHLELFPCLLPTSHIYNFLRMGNKSLILKKLQSLLSGHPPHSLFWNM